MAEGTTKSSKETNDHPSVDAGRGAALLASLSELTKTLEESAHAGESCAYMLIFSEQRMPTMYPVGQEAIIGRSRQADICIEHESVSRRHARIHRENDGRFLLVDLDSRHGTRINGRPVKRQALESGDRLRFGGTSAVLITFRSRFEELLIELQCINATHGWAVGTALNLNTTNQALRAALLQLKALSGPDEEPAKKEALRSVIADLEDGLQRHEELAEELRQLAHIGDFGERRILVADLLQPVIRAIPFPIHPPFQLITNIDAEVWVTCSPDLIRQMVMELVVNALGAMPLGGTLRVSAQRVELDRAEALAFLAPGPNLRIVVADSGVGMPPETRRRAFEPFFSTKSAYEGSGLGLTKVQQIVKSHLGLVELNSRLGEGTTITIHLPLLDDRDV